MQIDLSAAIALQLLTIVVSSAATFAVLNYRVKRLEQHNNDNKDVRDRLIVIETLIRQIKTNL